MKQEAIEKIYEDIGQLQIELEPDPTVLGPLYINKIVSQCRNYLNRVSLILLKLSRERRSLKRQLAGEETLLGAERDRLLAEDDTVKRQANIRDREAVANTMLRERLNTIASLKNELLDMETVEKAVALIHSELVRTSNEIKTQRSLLHADRISGAGYGDEFDNPRRGQVLPQNSIEEDELDKLMAGASVDEARASMKPAADSEEAALEPEVKTAVETPVEAKVEGPKPQGTDPSQGLEEDPGVARFLEAVSEAPVVETQPVPEPVKVKKSEDDFDDDFLAGILKNY